MTAATTPAPAEQAKAKKPASKKQSRKPKAASKPKQSKKVKKVKKAKGPKLVWTKSKVTGILGDPVKVLGQTLKSRMLRVDAAFADMLTKRAKAKKVSVCELTRSMVK